MLVDLRPEHPTHFVVPVVQLLDGPSVSGLADWLGDRLSSAGPPEPDPIVAAATRAARPNGAPGPEATGGAGSRWMDLLAQLPEIPEDDVDGLLRGLLAAREGKHDG